MSAFYFKHLIAMISALGLFATVSGCGSDSDDDVVFPNSPLVVIQGALAAGNLDFANGTYTNCTNRTGEWSLDIGTVSTLTHTALSVVKDNTDCVLTLTSLVVNDILYDATSPIVLGTAYQGTSSSFAIGEGPPIAFYGNAKLNEVTFNLDFVITILYSDDPNIVIVDDTACFTMQTGTAVAVGVLAPNYAISMDSLDITVNDANIVQTAVGDAVLTDVSVTGQDYVLVTSLAGTTYDAVNSAFIGGTPVAIGANPEIPAASFSLVGATLPQTRYIIVANTLEGVPSYQVFTITFLAP